VKYFIGALLLAAALCIGESRAACTQGAVEFIALPSIATGDPTAGMTIRSCDSGAWSTATVGAPAASIPAGLITFVVTGACPSGWSEVTALAGKTLSGTLTANADVGTTGGSDTITPAGTVAAPTFTGSSATSSAVSAGTPAGTNATSTVTPLGTVAAPVVAWPAGVPTHSGTTATFTGNAVTAASTTSGTKLVTANTSTGVSPITTATGTVNITSQGTIAWPAGVPTNTAPAFTGSSSTVTAQTFTGSALGTHTHTVTATGTNSAPAFTGTQFDNRPAFTRVIFCSKN
jgi:hypothetical protein